MLADTAGEAGFVAAMKAGTNSGGQGHQPARHGHHRHYSLSGVTAAMTEIEQACA